MGRVGTGQDVAAAFADEETIWAYAIPDRQWIAMPDRRGSRLRTRTWSVGELLEMI